MSYMINTDNTYYDRFDIVVFCGRSIITLSVYVWFINPYSSELMF